MRTTLINSWVSAVISRNVIFNELKLKTVMSYMLRHKLFMHNSLVTEFFATRVDFGDDIYLNNPYWICIIEYANNNPEWLYENTDNILNTLSDNQAIIQRFKSFIAKPRDKWWTLLDGQFMVVEIIKTLKQNGKISYRKMKGHMSLNVLMRIIYNVRSVKDVFSLLNLCKDTHSGEDSITFIRYVILGIKANNIKFSDNALKDLSFMLLVNYKHNIYIDTLREVITPNNSNYHVS